MSQRTLVAVLLCAVLSMIAAPAGARAAGPPPLVAPTDARSPQEQQKLFHLPPGFEIQLFASEPAIHKPMNITFDAAGRLFVTDTLEYPYPAADDSAARDTVKILTDTNLDGAADEVTTFVDGLNIPLGVMPVPRGAIVYTIGSVLRCVDADGDGKADARDVLYGNFGSRDTHGMVNSFTHGQDGWLYACHGFANDSAPQGTDGHRVKMNSGNTFRMRFDGSRVEQFTHGQVNPFGLAFDPLGNLYSADCHSMPLYLLLRGAYYPSFGKAHDGLGFGPTMIKHDHGSTGIGGVAFYAAAQFPPEYRGTVFIGNPVTGRVNHDRLAAHGSTYEAIEQPDFITCDDPWFRPVNLQVGPDGALYIADFYNKIIGHYEVPLEHPGRDRERGRIWRVVYTGSGVDGPITTAPPIGPRVSQASLQRLLELLGDENLTLRTQATHELVERIGAPAIEPLRMLVASASSTPTQRAHGMWALERLKGLTPELLGQLARDGDRLVRVHTMKLLAERDAEHVSLVLAGLADSDPFVRRAAADALGRHPSAEHVQPLLKLWAATPAEDTHLIHVARMALRDQLLLPGVYAALPQMVGDHSDSLQRLAEVSLGAPTTESAEFVFAQLQAGRLPERRDPYLHHAARHISHDRLGEVYDFALSRTSENADEQARWVKALGRATQERGTALREDVNAWAARLASQFLAANQEHQVRDGIDLARDFKLPLFDALAAAAAPQARFANLRTTALEACAANDGARAVSLASGVLADTNEPLNLRQHAAMTLARINNDVARAELLKQLQTAPQRLAIDIAAALAESQSGAGELLAAIDSGKASPRLLQERAIVTRLQIQRVPDLNARLAKLTAGLPPDDERIRVLIDARRAQVAAGAGDVALGAKVFEKHCAACHRIGELGAKVGPNLDGVGIRGVERLLEDVLDPSRNVDQAFRTTQIVSTDGRLITGLPLREEGEVLVLADAQGKEVRVPKSEIDERAESPLSLMPTNVPELVSEPDFVHLMGYLLSQRVAAAAK
ncbi:MAG: PVC-type heme-binding CxxCH protein [Pirellulales bacterium]